MKNETNFKDYESFIEAKTNEIETMIESDPESYLSYYFDYVEDDDLIKNFLRNFKARHVVYRFAKFDDTNQEAQDILGSIGRDNLIQLLLDHSYIKLDGDIYHEHWNDLYSFELDDYEYQLDYESHEYEYEFLKNFKDEKHVSYYRNSVSVWLYLNLGILRLKLNVDTFEDALKNEYGLNMDSIYFKEEA